MMPGAFATYARDGGVSRWQSRSRRAGWFFRILGRRRLENARPNPGAHRRSVRLGVCRSPNGQQRWQDSTPLAWNEESAASSSPANVRRTTGKRGAARMSDGEAVPGPGCRFADAHRTDRDASTTRRRAHARARTTPTQTSPLVEWPRPPQNATLTVTCDELGSPSRRDRGACRTRQRLLMVSSPCPTMTDRPPTRTREITPSPLSIEM